MLHQHFIWVDLTFLIQHTTDARTFLSVVYVALMDFEKAYDEIDKNALRQVPTIYGIVGNLLKAV